jgi:hypothetical protein
MWKGLPAIRGLREGVPGRTSPGGNGERACTSDAFTTPVICLYNASNSPASRKLDGLV